MNGKYYYGTGRRKSSVARVFLTKGTGQIIVNGRPVDEFFARETSVNTFSESNQKALLCKAFFIYKTIIQYPP